MSPPIIGKTVKVEKLYEAARIITDKYRKDGYFLSQALVPDQTIADGYYRIRIIEGYVSDVLIQGDGSALSNRWCAPICRRFRAMCR